MKVLILLILLMAQAHATVAMNSDNKTVCSYANQVELNQAIFKIMDVNNWKNIIGIPDQSFYLYNSKGVRLNRLARTGDLIRIKLPLDPSKGSYWVKIEDLKRVDQYFSLRVRPTLNPKLPYKKNVTDHFFTNKAQNTFSASLKKSSLIVRVQGTHEEANTSQARTLLDAKKNLAIATMGWGYYAAGESKYGFQGMIWKIFTKEIANCH